MTTTINPILSDLFFNHEHPSRDAVYSECYASDMTPLHEDLLEATEQDAKRFLDAYGSILIDVPTVEELTEDFMRRV